MSTRPVFFNESSDSDTDSHSYSYDPTTDTDTDTALPFPKPLDRSSFLTTTFSAAGFLSTLTSRFQTLEDLQSELQDLLKSLNKELVDLVNDNYTDFLSLGEKLKGGEERIEEVRVGLLGFQRDVTGVRDLVGKRSEDVRGLLEEKRVLRREMAQARRLLEVGERFEEIEERLGLKEHAPKSTVANNDAQEELIGDFKDWDDEWTQEPDFDSLSDEEDEDTEDDTSHDLPRRTRRNMELYQAIQLLSQQCGAQHPFILAQRDRADSIKDALRKDLEAGIRAQSDVKAKQRIIQMRARLDE